MNPKHFHGKPCRACKSTLRYRSTKGCVPCRNARTLKANRAEYAADPEIQRRRSTKYRERNRERERERYRRWLASNPDKRRASCRANKQRRQQAVGEMSQAEVNRLFQDQGGKCAYFDLCGSLLGQDFRCDHIVPVVAGGPNYAWNRQLLCDPCNQKKKDADPVKFAVRHGLDSRRALQAVSMLGQLCGHERARTSTRPEYVIGSRA